MTTSIPRRTPFRTFGNIVDYCSHQVIILLLAAIPVFTVCINTKIQIYEIIL